MIHISNKELEKTEYFRSFLKGSSDFPTISSLFCVILYFHSGMCVKISKYKKIIKLWANPRRKVRDSSPCFCTSCSLGTVAPWLIACDKTTHNKCQEGAPMGSQVQSPACAVTWVSILSGN